MSHFATFPEELPRRCILAGTSEKGCCPACGKPWERVVEKSGGVAVDRSGKVDRSFVTQRNGGFGSTLDGEIPLRSTTGWQPGCECNAEPVPCVVLDPFLGSGTTLAVAAQLGREGIGIELNPEYAKLAEDRIGRATNPSTYRNMDKAYDAPLFLGDIQ